jgi:hypothetical protein
VRTTLPAYRTIVRIGTSLLLVSALVVAVTYYGGEMAEMLKLQGGAEQHLGRRWTGAGAV